MIGPGSLKQNRPVTTTVTGKNQITLPAEIVRALDLRPGVQIEWSTTPDGALIGKRRLSRAELAARLAGRGRRYLRAGRDPVADLVAERAREDVAEGLA